MRHPGHQLCRPQLTARQLIVCAATLLTATAAAQQPTTTRPGKRVPFTPGVLIDWGVPQVEVQTRVVLTTGLLELFACTPNTREHESILQLQATAEHVYQALGLIGLQPGHPVQWDAEAQRVIPAVGDPLELRVRWQPEPGGAPPQELDVTAWMLAVDTNRPPPPQQWVFAGSVRDRHGRLAAEYEGTIVAVVDFAGALIALPNRHSDSNAQLWLQANPEAIPPLGTPCVLIIRPAVPRPMTIRLDRLGRLRADDRAVTRAELQEHAADMLERHAAAGIVLAPAAGTPAQDVEEVRGLLRRAGWSDEQIEVRPLASQPAAQTGALRELLQARLSAHRDLAESLERNGQELSSRLSNRQRSAQQTAERLLQGLHQLGLELRSRFGQPQPKTRPANHSAQHGNHHPQPG